MARWMTELQGQGSGGTESLGCHPLIESPLCAAREWTFFVMLPCYIWRCITSVIQAAPSIATDSLVAPVADPRRMSVLHLPKAIDILAFVSLCSTGREYNPHVSYTLGQITIMSTCRTKYLRCELHARTL
jgi:hypothetical protein